MSSPPIGPVLASCLARPQSRVNGETWRVLLHGCMAADDAAMLFRKMLESGHPPDDWNQLLEEARAEGQRLQQFAIQ